MRLAELQHQLEWARVMLENAGRESASSTVTLTIRLAKGKHRRYSARYRGIGGFGVYWDEVAVEKKQHRRPGLASENYLRIGDFILAMRPSFFQQEWEAWGCPTDVFLAALIAADVGIVTPQGSPPSSWVVRHPAMAAAVLIERMLRELEEPAWASRVRVDLPEQARDIRRQKDVAVACGIDARTLRNWRKEAPLTKYPGGRLDLNEARAFQERKNSASDRAATESLSRSRKKRKSSGSTLPSE